ncbi:LamB/YcsF family protein [Veillonella parvula]|uniref:LamB/YcsF family protein n=1 Tax=Veillonella parvula TaxID=29466 RepID=UPI00241F241A|nr:5-oxoprolinase subunit PxpA [Veillonella parvula]MBS5153108.1 5-oxoprolinase subunit PxpA [Veillonella parvula]
MSHYVDLNSDLGESFGNYTLGMDSEVLNHVTSANIACGGHAGDPIIMDATVRICKEKGVAVGAHPGYPDLMGFGRRVMAVNPAEAKVYMMYQLGALQAFCDSHGLTVQHMKLHGAFYNTACVTPVLADAILDGLQAVNPTIAAMVLSGSYIAQEAQRRGIPVIQEVFADRGYTEEGTLVPRTEVGAFIKDPQEALDRVLMMVTKGKVVTNTGKTIDIVADSICVHGDNPEAIAFTKYIWEGLSKAGITVANFQHR